MKKLILLLLLFSQSGYALDCRNASKYNEKADFTFTVTVGKPYCVMGPFSKEDYEFIADWWVDDDELNILLNNIRSNRDIDISFYGYNSMLKKSLSSKIDGVNSVNYIKRFNKNGQPILKANKRLNELKSLEVDIKYAQICASFLREAMRDANGNDQKSVASFLNTVQEKLYKAYKRNTRKLRTKALDKVLKKNQELYDKEINQCIDLWKVSDRRHKSW